MTYQSELKPEPFPFYTRGSDREFLEQRHYEYQDNELPRETGSDSNGARRSAERAAVRSRVAAGQRDPNALTDWVFFRRHPELGGRKLRADQKGLVEEWKAILRDIVLPELGSTGASPATGTKIRDREVAETLRMATKTIPGLGITLEELLVRHQAESGGIPTEVLLAFIHFEAGSCLFDDATAGHWDKQKQKYIPSPEFYELGIFQTPAGTHGCIWEADTKKCKYRPPGRNVENSEFGKGWYCLKGTYPTEGNWNDPTMQVRIGLWNLRSPGERIAKEFPALFPSGRSEWYLRMAVLYSFAQGAGWTRAFLSKYQNELLALPESRRWNFLRGKQAYLKNYVTKKTKTKTFDPENVDKKIMLAAKLRAVRGATVMRKRKIRVRKIEK